MMADLLLFYNGRPIIILQNYARNMIIAICVIYLVSVAT